MKLTAQIKLNTTKEQAKLLLNTMELANACCNFISDYCFQHKVFGKFKIQSAIYYTLKEKFSLSAQMLVRCIGKVSYAYALDKDAKRIFKKHGAIAYDSRILSYKTIHKEVNIWTLEGRQSIPYFIGEHQSRMLEYQQGESDLIYIKGTFYLLATCDIPDEETRILVDVIGIDFGIENIATTSDGKIYSGKQVEGVRQYYAKRRATLQSVGTKSAKRRLKKLSGKEKRFKKDTNHKISKELVCLAKDTNCSIAIEDLKGIRTRTTVRKKQRAKHSSWAFNQLGMFITYKAQLAGIPVILVNPKYTSQRCFSCGHIEKANRKSQSEFVCVKCFHCDNADVNGSKNIQLLGIRQNTYGSGFSFEKSVTSPQPLGVGI